MLLKPPDDGIDVILKYGYRLCFISAYTSARSFRLLE